MQKITCLLLVFFFLIISCKTEKSEPQQKTSALPKAVAVNYPLHFFAQRIGGDLIEAEYLIPDDVDPAYWIPDEQTISIYQQADLIIANGANYAKWMEKVSLPGSRVVNSSGSFADNYIELEAGMTHSHGPEGEHEHLGYAFTTWLNFQYAIQQASTIKNALVKLLPGSEAVLEANFGQLKTELSAIDEQMSQIAVSLNGATLFGSHPVYQYLAQGYGVTILCEHWEPDREPTKQQWQVFKDKLTNNPARIMLWEDRPLEGVNKKLNEMGIQVVVFNPCGNRPESGDFMDIMKENIEQLSLLLQ